MTVNAEAIRQHQAYKAARQRIFEAGRTEAKVSIPAPEPICESVPQPVVKFIWVRQYNAHVIAYRQWQLAEEQGKEYLPQPPRADVHEIIMDVLADFPGVSIADVKGPRRNKAVVRARQLAVYEVYRRRPDLSYPQIGRIFGDRDHTTCLHAVRKISAERGPARI